ncbi:MAG: glycerophosphodiester phosphodiesterase family protein [Erysipelotrichaceae bacterium]|nr:glycerophosphodiester phosphodiesterase family protein [Erysipelotrichaceae bacterium]
MTHFIIIILIIFLIYLFLIMPRYKTSPTWVRLSNYHYAHRGFHDHNAPENTIAAFQLAIDHNYGFELDIQRTKDNELVVFHDFDLKRACNIDKKIADIDHDQLKELTIFDSDHHIPLFDDVLRLVHGQVPLIIEIKLPNNDTTTCELAAKMLDQYPGDFCIESFNPLAVKWFKINRPEWIRGQLAADFSKDDTKSFALSFILENLLLNVVTRPDFVAFDVNELYMLSINIFHKILKGKTVLWTIRDKETFNRYQDKYDLFIFENFTI